MNLEMLKEELRRDEGYVLRVYEDSEGYATLGVGHLIRKDDPEADLPIGAPVTADVVEKYFEDDLDAAIKDSKKFFKKFDEFPPRVQHIVVNMMFNLGYTRLAKFKKWRKAVREHKWDKAADEMVDSKWFHQVKSRSRRLVNQMRSISVD